MIRDNQSQAGYADTSERSCGLMRNVTALIDQSPFGRSVVDHAAWAAFRLGASVDLLHVLPEDAASAEDDPRGEGGRASFLQALTAFDDAALGDGRARGEALLEDAETRLELKGLDRPRGRLRYGDLVEALHAAEEEAELIVVGKRGEAATLDEQGLGANLERVVRAAARPVLVAGRAFHAIRRATLAFDGGPSARKALDYLTVSPLFRDVRIIVLAAKERRNGAADGALAEAVEALTAAGRAPETRLVDDEAKAALAAHVEAERPDLLVMGAYGHSRLRNLFIGSVTSETLRCCRPPVLLFR